MSAPARVLQTIDRLAAEHETTAARILDGDLTKETVEARRAVVTELARTKKPAGNFPALAEVARWLNLSTAQVSRIVASSQEHA